MSLSHKTVIAMQSVFRGKVCRDCGRPAERLVNSKKLGGDAYYCQQCWNNTGGKRPAAYEVPRLRNPKTLRHGSKFLERD
jgi:hypothetical protein